MTQETFVLGFCQIAKDRGSRLSDDVLTRIANGCWDAWVNRKMRAVSDWVEEKQVFLDGYMMMWIPAVSYPGTSFLTQCRLALCAWLRYVVDGKSSYMPKQGVARYSQDDMVCDMATLARRYGSAVSLDEIVSDVKAHWDNTLKRGHLQPVDGGSVCDGHVDLLGVNLSDRAAKRLTESFIEVYGYKGLQASLMQEWLPKMIRDPSAMDDFVKAVQAVRGELVEELEKSGSR